MFAVAAATEVFALVVALAVVAVASVVVGAAVIAAAAGLRTYFGCDGRSLSGVGGSGVVCGQSGVVVVVVVMVVVVAVEVAVAAVVMVVKECVVSQWPRFLQRPRCLRGPLWSWRLSRSMT